MEQPDEKKCTGCNKTKSLTEFSRRGHGYQSRCKLCRSEKAREARKAKKIEAELTDLDRLAVAFVDRIRNNPLSLNKALIELEIACQQELFPRSNKFQIRDGVLIDAGFIGFDDHVHLCKSVVVDYFRQLDILVGADEVLVEKCENFRIQRAYDVTLPKRCRISQIEQEKIIESCEKSNFVRSVIIPCNPTPLVEMQKIVEEVFRKNGVVLSDLSFKYMKTRGTILIDWEEQIFPESKITEMKIALANVALNTPKPVPKPAKANWMMFDEEDVPMDPDDEDRARRRTAYIRNGEDN